MAKLRVSVSPHSAFVCFGWVTWRSSHVEPFQLLPPPSPGPPHHLSLLSFQSRFTFFHIVRVSNPSSASITDFLYITPNFIKKGPLLLHFPNPFIFLHLKVPDFGPSLLSSMLLLWTILLFNKLPAFSVSNSGTVSRHRHRACWVIGGHSFCFITPLFSVNIYSFRRAGVSVPEITDDFPTVANGGAKAAWREEEIWVMWGKISKEPEESSVQVHSFKKGRCHNAYLWNYKMQINNKTYSGTSVPSFRAPATRPGLFLHVLQRPRGGRRGPGGLSHTSLTPSW